MNMLTLITIIIVITCIAQKSLHPYEMVMPRVYSNEPISPCMIGCAGQRGGIDRMMISLCGRLL